MSYDVQIRYSPQIRGNWDDIRISVIRPDVIGQDSDCYNINPLEEQERSLKMHEYETSVIALPDLCLEEGKTYKFIVSFHRQSIHEPNPKAQILIDSVRIFKSHLMLNLLLIFILSLHSFQGLKSHLFLLDPHRLLYVNRNLTIIDATILITMCQLGMRLMYVKNLLIWLLLKCLTELHVRTLKFVCVKFLSNR